MPTEDLDRVLEGVRALTPAERRELRNWLDAVPAPSNANEDALDERLLAAGVIARVPAPITDLATHRRWKPIAIKGKPLSQTIIEERR